MNIALTLALLLVTETIIIGVLMAALARAHRRVIDL